MKFIYKKRKKTTHLIATSDIAFLLLIFLVVTSSLEYSPEIVPPKTDYFDNLNKDTESVAIEINENGDFNLLNYTFLAEELPGVLANVSTDTLIKIYADKDTDFGRITLLLDALQTDNRLAVFLMMEKDKSEKE